MKQEEPYLLTSLIRRLTEILHEEGDLPVFVLDGNGDEEQAWKIIVRDPKKEFRQRVLPKRVSIE